MAHNLRCGLRWEAVVREVGVAAYSEGYYRSLAPSCNVCGLDYSSAHPADGPAFFVMMTTAVPATAFGVWLELTYSPPLWVHAVTTVPIVVIGCTLPLRFFKGWLVATQYIRKAEQGRLAEP